MNSFFTKHKVIQLIFVLLLLVAGYLRIYKWDRQSLWIDELYSVYGAKLPSLSLVLNYSKEDPHPALFQILLYIFDKVQGGANETSFKWFPISISLFQLLLVYFFAKRFSTLFGFFLIGLFGLSPGILYYSQEVRSYSLLLFFSTILTYFLYKNNFDVSKWKKSELLFLWILLLLCAYTHLFGFLFWGFVLLCLFLYNLLKNRVGTKLYFYLGLGLFIGFFPFLWELYISRKVETASWIEPPNLTLGLVSLRFLAYSSKKYLFLGMIVPLVFYSVWLFQILRVFLVRSSEKITRDLGRENLSFCFVLGFLFLSLGFSFFHPIVTAKNWLVVLPMLYFATAERLSNLRHRTVTVCIFLILQIVSTLDFKKEFYQVYKEDWRSAADVSIKICKGLPTYTNSHPEYLQLYQSWYQGKIENINLAQEILDNRFCHIDRFLEGKPLSILSSPSWKRIEQKEVYGFTITSWEKIN